MTQILHFVTFLKSSSNCSYPSLQVGMLILIKVGLYLSFRGFSKHPEIYRRPKSNGGSSSHISSAHCRHVWDAPFPGQHFLRFPFLHSMPEERDALLKLVAFGSVAVILIFSQYGKTSSFSSPQSLLLSFPSKEHSVFRFLSLNTPQRSSVALNSSEPSATDFSFSCLFSEENPLRQGRVYLNEGKY